MSMKQYSKELKLELVKKHLEDGISYWKLGKEYGIEASIIRRWGHKYETFGEDGLEKQNADLCNYSAEFKKIVLEYLGGNITSQDLAAKYKIHAPSTVRTWIKQYNNHEDLTNSRKEGVYLMAKNGARKNTTLEERINIVEECINTGCNYASTANKYGCSYGQVYAWVRKYKDKGIEGLYDRRGKNKAIYLSVKNMYYDSARLIRGFEDIINNEERMPQMEEYQGIFDRNANEVQDLLFVQRITNQIQQQMSKKMEKEQSSSNSFKTYFRYLLTDI